MTSSVKTEDGKNIEKMTDKQMSLKHCLTAIAKCIAIMVVWNLILISLLTINSVSTSDRLSMLLTCYNEFDVLFMVVMQCNVYFTVAAIYIYIDYRNEYKNQLSTKRIVYPQRKPLEKVDWNLVNSAIQLRYTYFHIILIYFNMSLCVDAIN